MNLKLAPTPPKDPRPLALGLAVAAAVLLVLAAFSRTWVARPQPEVGFGPLGCTGCDMFSDPFADHPGSMSNSAFIAKVRETNPAASERETSSAFAPMGYVTFVLSLLSALGLFAAAALGFMRKTVELAIHPTTVALLGIMTGLITGCVFVATKPGGPGFVGVSIGFWLFSIGCVLGITGAQKLAKLLRPTDPELEPTIE